MGRIDLCAFQFRATAAKESFTHILLGFTSFPGPTESQPSFYLCLPFLLIFIIYSWSQPYRFSVGGSVQAWVFIAPPSRLAAGVPAQWVQHGGVLAGDCFPCGFLFFLPAGNAIKWKYTSHFVLRHVQEMGMGKEEGRFAVEPWSIVQGGFWRALRAQFYWIKVWREPSPGRLALGRALAGSAGSWSNPCFPRMSCSSQTSCEEHLQIRIRSVWLSWSLCFTWPCYSEFTRSVTLLRVLPAKCRLLQGCGLLWRVEGHITDQQWWYWSIPSPVHSTLTGCPLKLALLSFSICNWAVWYFFCLCFTAQKAHASWKGFAVISQTQKYVSDTWCFLEQHPVRRWRIHHSPGWVIPMAHYSFSYKLALFFCTLNLSNFGSSHWILIWLCLLD